jgi:hypothetical protein
VAVLLLLPLNHHRSLLLHLRLLVAVLLHLRLLVAVLLHLRLPPRIQILPLLQLPERPDWDLLNPSQLSLLMLMEMAMENWTTLLLLLLQPPLLVVVVV